jgi:hypothetical protein
MQVFSTGTVLFFCFTSLSMIAGGNLVERVADYRKKYSNTELHNQDFKKDFAQLWDLFQRRTLDEKIISLKESLIHDAEVREEFLKKPAERDYSFLIRESLYTQNHTAHAHIYNYLIDNPSQENLRWVPFYFATLTTNDRRTVFDKKLRIAIQREDSAALCALIQEAQLYEVKDPFEYVAEIIFDKDSKRFAATAIHSLSAKLTLKAPLEVMPKKTSLTDEKTVTLKALLYAQHTPSYARELLEQRHNAIPFFITNAERLIKHNSQWQELIGELLINCFTSESGAVARLSIAKELTEKYAEKESVWHTLSPWLRIISTHYMMLNEATLVSDTKLTQLTKDLCTIDPAKLNAESKSYGEKVVQDVCAWMHRKESKIKNKTKWCDDLLKKGWQAPLQHDLNCEKNEQFYLGKDTWEGIAERNNNVVSAELCYAIGNGYASAAQGYMDDTSQKWRLDAYKWFLRSAQKGSIRGFEYALQVGTTKDRIKELKDASNLLIQRYPEDGKLIVLNNLWSLHNLANCPPTEWTEADKDYFVFCSKFFDKFVKDIPASPSSPLLAQATYARIYAYALNTASWCGDTIINRSLLQDLKQAFSALDIASHEDSVLFDPLGIMPQVLIDALQAALKNESEIQLTKEERAFVASILLEQVSYKGYQDCALLAQTVSAITGYECGKKDARAWCESLFKTDSQRLLFLASYDAASLVPYLASATMLDTMSLKPEECEDTNAKSVQDSMMLAFRKSQLVSNLRCIAQKVDTDAGQRALRLFLHYELYETLDEAKKYATQLLDLCKKGGDSIGAKKAEECLKSLIKQGLAQSVLQGKSLIVDKCVEHHNQLLSGTRTEQDKAKLCTMVKEYDDDPRMYALLSGEHALTYNVTGNKGALDAMLVSLGQVRCVGLNVPNSPWFRYITPLTKELLWKEACKKQTSMTPDDFGLIAYAAFLNEEKSYTEKKQLLQPAICKHPLCSLLYAQSMLEGIESKPKQTSIQEAFTIFKALRYAMVQGEKSVNSAADVATCAEAQTMLEEARGKGSLGAAITLASIHSDIGLAAPDISKCPFEMKDNKIVVEPVPDDYIKMAHEMGVLEPLKRAAEKNNDGAQKAIFRLCFPQVLQSMADSEKKKGEDANSAEIVLLYYSLPYIKTAGNVQRLPLKKLVSSVVEALLKTEISKATSNNLTRLKTALLVV